jgi:dethiobiotin synthetase
MDLGCINHAILTAEAIRKDNLVLAGWVANQIVPVMNRYKENVSTLQHWISSPMIGELAHNPNATPHETADQLNIKSLL